MTSLALRERRVAAQAEAFGTSPDVLTQAVAVAFALWAARRPWRWFSVSKRFTVFSLFGRGYANRRVAGMLAAEPALTAAEIDDIIEEAFGLRSRHGAAR